MTRPAFLISYSNVQSQEYLLFSEIVLIILYILSQFGLQYFFDIKSFLNFLTPKGYTMYIINLIDTKLLCFYLKSSSKQLRLQVIHPLRSSFGRTWNDWLQPVEILLQGSTEESKTAPYSLLARYVNLIILLLKTLKWR